MNIRSRAFKIIYFTLIIALFLTIITSCKSKEEKPNPSKEEKEKIPKELESMEEKTEEVIKEIEKLQEEIEKPLELMKPKDEKKKEEGNEGNESKEEGQKSDQKQGGEEGGSKEDIEKKKAEAELEKKEKIMKMWESIGKKSEEIHASWNDYETTAIEDGASNEDITKFEDALNKLTIAVEEKKDMDCLIYLNSMIQHMSRFFDFYKGNPDGEALRLKYYARQMYLDAALDSWDAVEQNVEKLESTMDRLTQKTKLEKEKEELLNKLKLSVEDMKNAVKEKNKELLKIKMDIILKNLEEVRKEAK